MRLVDIGKLQRACEHAAAHEARLESRALLVRPIDHGKVCLRGKLAYAHGLVNRPRRAQRRDHAVCTVIHAAVFLAVKMRSAQDIRRRIVPGEQAENVPYGIDAHLGAGLAQLLD